MNWKLLSIPTTLFASALTLAVACQPCEGNECDFTTDAGGEQGSTGGGAGDGSGGKSGGGGTTASGGATTGGNGGLGGSLSTGGTTATVLDCQPTGDASGTPAPSCGPTTTDGDPNFACEACVQALCCDEFEQCNALEPATACRYGATVLDGASISGEFDCIIECLYGIPQEDYVGGQDELDACASLCGSAECDDTKAGPAATSLAGCMLGLTTPSNPAGCQVDCEMNPATAF
jgi:hypothetical protein